MLVCCPLPTRTLIPNLSASRALNVATMSRVSPEALRPCSVVVADRRFDTAVNGWGLRRELSELTGENVSLGVPATVCRCRTRETLIALRQGSVGMLPPYCQLFIQAIMIRRPSGTLLNVTPA